MGDAGFRDLLGMDGPTTAEGRARVAVRADDRHVNPSGAVHGGVIATLLDSAAGCAVHSVLPEGTGYTSVDLSTKFLRAVSVASGRITAEGVVLNRGSRTALAQATLTDERGRLLAHATSTCLIFDLPQPVTDPTDGGAAAVRR